MSKYVRESTEDLTQWIEDLTAEIDGYLEWINDCELKIEAIKEVLNDR